MKNYGLRAISAVLALGATLFLPNRAVAVTVPTLFVASQTCQNANVSPLQGGSAPSSPGHWTNRSRYGTGWDFVYSDDNKSLKAFFFTYSSKGFPVWLTTPFTTLSTDADGSYFSAPLQEYSQAANGVISTVPAGSVAFRFLANDPTKLAVRWDWTDLDNAAFSGIATPQLECLQDIARTPPNCFTTTNCAGTGTQSTETVPAYTTASGVNQLWSGYWNTAGNGTLHPESVPGVVVEILQTSQGDTGVGQFAEFDLITTFDLDGNPVWYQAQSPNSSSLPPYQATSIPVSYNQPNPTIYVRGTPYQDCSAKSCISTQSLTANLIRTFGTGTDAGKKGSVHWDQQLHQPSNQFNTTAPVQHIGATFPAVSTDLEIDKIVGSKGIVVDQYECYPTDSSHTCSVFVSWNAPDNSYYPVKKNLRTGAYASIVVSGTSNMNGVAPDVLQQDDRVDYELWQSALPPNGQFVAKTAEVRAFGPNNDDGSPYVADDPAASLSGELPAHDPSVGAMAGTAGVSGGAATYTVPIVVPPGRNGMQPQLALSYNSRSANGIAGLGWSISGASSIHRCPQTVAQDGKSRPVQLDAGDRLCLDGQRLVPTNSTATYGSDGTIYDTEVRSFSQVTQTGAISNSAAYFTVLTKDGHTMTYGAAPTNWACGTGTAQEVPYFSNGTQIPLSWLLTRAQDAQGNTIDYCYAAGSAASNAGEVVLSKVIYTGTSGTPGSRSVVFSYNLRSTGPAGANDWTTSYVAGGLIRQGFLLSRIDTYAPNASGASEHVRSYALNYADVANNNLPVDVRTGRSLLFSITECGYVPSQSCRKPTQFNWSDQASDFVLKPVTAQFPQLPAAAAFAGPGKPSREVTVLGDFDGDGTPELLVRQTDQATGLVRSYLAKTTADRASNGGYVDLSSINNVSFLPGYVADFGGDGLSEALSVPASSGNISLYVWNLSSYPRGSVVPAGVQGSSVFTAVPTNIAFNATNGTPVATADFDGDGYTDILVMLYAGSSCGGQTIPSGSRALCLYLNQSKQPLANLPTGQTFQFSSGSLIYQWDQATYSLQSQQQTLDLNSDGAPDVIIQVLVGVSYQPAFVLMSTIGKVPSGCTATPYSPLFVQCTFPALAIPMDAGATGNGEAYAVGAVQFWIDLNGDNLPDLLYANPNGCSDGGTLQTNASTSAGVWCVKMNTGNGFSSVAGVVGGNAALRKFANGKMAYAGGLKVMDVDNDGHPEILYPSAIAARSCGFVREDVQSGTLCHEIQPLIAGSSTQTSGAYCYHWACAEDPNFVQNVSGYALPQAGSADDNYDIVGLHSYTGQNGFHPDDVVIDTSTYVMSALRFVMVSGTGARALQFSLSKGGTHTVLSGLVNSSLLSNSLGPQSIYGDGLQDLTGAAMGCNPNVHSTVMSTEPNCYLDASSSPISLPDGTPVSHLDVNGRSVSDLISDVVYINENTGVGITAADNQAPLLPELMSAAFNALGDYAEWDYAPLSSKAGRGSSEVPLYTLGDGNYVSDPEYSYFQSSMPVVSAIWQNNGASSAAGFRSFEYGYSGAIYDHLGRGFQGFRKITQDPVLDSTSVDANNVTRGLRTVTTYAQKFPLTGQIVEQDVGFATSGSAMSNVSVLTNNYACAIGFNATPTRTQFCPGDSSSAPAPLGNTFYFPYIDTSSHYTYDLVSAQQGTPTIVSISTVYNASTSSAARANGTSKWDKYGNLLEQIVADTDFDSHALLLVHRKTTMNVFDPQVNGNGFGWTGKLQSTTIFQSASYGNVVPSGVATTAPTVETLYAWNCDRSLSWKAVVDLNAGSAPTAQTGCNSNSASTAPPVPTGTMVTNGYTYPTTTYGLPATTTVNASIPAGAPSGVTFTARTTSFAYSSDGYFVNMLTNPLSQSTSTHTRNEDGQLDYAADANGITVTTTYDAFGHPTGVSSSNPNGTAHEPSSASSWTSCPSTDCTNAGEPATAAYMVTTVKDGTPTTIVGYDVLGRAVDQAHRGYAPGISTGTYVHETTVYDRMGTVASKTAPFYQGSTSWATTYKYDALDRVMLKVAPTAELNASQGNTQTTYTYSGDLTTIAVKALGTNACSVANLCFTITRVGSVLGKYVQTTEPDPNSSNDSNSSGKIVTSYWYDGAGNSTGLQDGNGHNLTATYNAFGQRTQSVDPNQGTWSFLYDGLGELILQTDARGAVVTVTQRDALGRVLQKTAVPPVTVPQGMANEATKDVWVYDVASGGAGGVNGSLTSNTRYRGTTLGSAVSVWSESYMYDVNSKRLTQRIVNQEGESTQLATKYQFDSYYGREKAVTYPSGFTVWRQYDPYGHLSTLVDLATLTPMWSETSSDAFGHATSEQFGTRVVGAHTYSASTGQATALNWTTPQGGVLDGLAYTYDSLGNLAQQSRPSVPGSESYSYDLLQRLVSTTRSTAGTVTYQYDPVGNIMAKSDYSQSGYGSYHYSATQPNAVTSVTLANGQTATYSYDANGNEIGPTSGYTIQEMYDANNQARTITRGGTANFFYAPNGSRYRETSSATNIFGSDGYERTVDGNGTTHRHELGPVVYTLNGGTGKTTYMLRDRLGSVISESDTNGNVVYDATGQNSKAQRTYDAFGKVRNTDYSDRSSGVLSLADTTLRGFTGQEHVDNVQVIHMNGRIYDYQLGRFLGVDPIIGNPIKSQSLNPYSYIGNNPLSGVDPTGFKAFCMGDKTCQALDDMDFLGGAAGKLRNSLTYGGAGGGGFQLLALDTEGKSRMAAVLPQITMSGIDTVDIAMSTVSAMAPSSVGPTTLITPIEEVGPTILEHPIVRWGVGVAGPYLLELAEPVAIAVGVGFLTLTPSNVGQCNSGCGCGSLVCGPAPSPVLPIADQGPSLGGVGLPTTMTSSGGAYIDVPGNKIPFTGAPDSTVRGGTGSRTFGPDGYPLRDRDWPHPDEKGVGAGDHAHDWGRPAGGGPPTAADRGLGRLPVPGDPPAPRGPNVPPPSGGVP